MRRRTTVTLAGAAALVLLGASPAMAAPPEGLYFVQWGGDLYEMDPDTLATSLVGDGLDDIAITGLDVDDAGQGYAVDYDANPATLYEVDVLAGTIVPLAPLRYADGEPVVDCTGLDYTNGVVYVACDNSDQGSDVGTVDPSTGILTPMLSGTRVAALAVDPSSGILYGFSYGFWDDDLDSWVTYLVSYEEGVETVVETMVGGVTFYAADFQADGTVLWTLADEDDGDLAELDGTDLNGWSLRVLSGYLEGEWTENLTVLDSEPVAPVEEELPEEETLPATGADSAALLTGAAVALLGGFVLLAVRLRQRRLEV